MQNAARIAARFALDPLTVLGSPATIAALPHALKAQVRLAAALVCQSDEQRASGSAPTASTAELIAAQQRLDELSERGG